VAKSRRIRLAGYTVCTILREEATWETQVNKRKGTVKMVLKEMGHENVNWVQPAQDRVQWWVLMNMGVK
jgi:hypothetical protein